MCCVVLKKEAIFAGSPQKCFIMTVLYGAVLLAVLVACGETAPTPEECEDLVKPLEASAFNKVGFIHTHTYIHTKTCTR